MCQVKEGVQMTHDIEDLLEIIRRLELRIIDLEKGLDQGVQHIPPDGWYFEY
jgi:hypothetical protein